MSAIVPAVDFTTRILIVDDDESIRELMSDFLGRHGYDVDAVSDAAQMRRAIVSSEYDLIVLDVMMPGEDGLTALRSMQTGNTPPVIMLSAVGTDVDRIIGLELGADDYLVKPCNPRELLARITTVLRRSSSKPATEGAKNEAAVLRFDEWWLDLADRTLTDPTGKRLSLSDGEFRLLRAFVEHPRRVLTRDQLLDWSKGGNSDTYDRAIDVQISRLRRRLSEGEGGDALIRTIRREGYMFAPRVHST